jgi:hypothetical protein
MGLFDYPDELETIKKIKREKRRVYLAKWLGRPIGTWGGVRKGAGRRKDPNAKPRAKSVTVFLKINSLQEKLLVELGEGVLTNGVMACIKAHIGG